MPHVDLNIVHFNVHVRAQWGKLLSRDHLEDLLLRDDIGVTIEVLLNSYYAREMAEALARYQGVDAIEEAVGRHMLNTYQALISHAEGRFGELVRLFFNRWDLAAVKTLLRGVHCTEEPDDRLDGLVPGPTLTMPLVRELAQSTTVADLVDRLRAWNPDLCGCLGEHVRAYRDTGGVAVLEDALDRHYYETTIRELERDHDDNAQVLRRALQFEVDRLNLRMLLSDPEADLRRKQARLLPDGALRALRVRHIARSQTIPQALELLVGTPYESVVEFTYQFMQTRRFSPLDRTLERVLITQYKRMARQHVLTIAVLISFAWLKYNEVKNLKLIARGQARHIPRGRVREEIIYA